ncbi:response regulator transcription factor [Meiothermus granaticius]|uniref:Transcriptional activator protein CopR n=1 Tax=Meiothermus granaticius NBRC 107808 TaxID=1227551 RepID=A0A399F640_9DEIN|nr:response regulator transcription factor [Meiothermus granaticius]MCL6527954.1 response regulator transcription factor [Thermaceae bacterium]RIH92124.1 Transcriptional activator protein CopR [Meiothermus granaticius NBRC 107808]GEM86261.1 response regulator [Meiothermus granaticius NBRC 107808]
MRLLVVEDEPSLSQTLCESLATQGFQPWLAASAAEAERVVWERPFDLFLLDVMLPEGEEAGFELAESLREAGFRQPILFLTAREGLPDRVRGLEVGDDYLPKPFALAELVARLRALARRGEVKPQVLRVGDRLEIAFERREVRYRGDLIRLTAKEYQVLELFALNAGRVFTREEVLERIWGPGFESDSNLIDVYIKNLRKRLYEGVIETVRGLGYRLGE